MVVDNAVGGVKYNSIGHLPESRKGSGDHSIDESSATIATRSFKADGYCVIVQEKLDGSNCSVQRVGGQLLACTRSGRLAQKSVFVAHQWFAAWVRRNESRFQFLRENERLYGEWLAQAHGTIYSLPHEPFVAFDLFCGDKRANFCELVNRVSRAGLVMPQLLSVGPPCSVKKALSLIDPYVHGALDPIEGAVWRIERYGVPKYMCKYVRPDKVDGVYLPKLPTGKTVYNWTPDWLD